MRRILHIFISLAVTFQVFAAPRSVQQALTEAQEFVGMAHSGKLQRAASTQTLQYTYTLEQPTAKTDAAYVFQRGTNGGFVIVSADDRARTILGYSDEGTFDQDNIPANMRTWLEYYARQIEAASESINETADGSHSAAIAQKPTTPVPSTPKTTTAIAPLLGNITWNQDAPYYNLCPMDGDNTRCYTGCVATAMAQIMRYWQYPTTGTGSHSYTWYNCNRRTSTLSANFGETTYDWANMLESYDRIVYTNAQATAVATLMYHVGVACDMSYGGDRAGGSGAQEGDAAHAFYTYFGYDGGIHALRADYIGQAAFESGVLAELQADRPVFLSGYTVNYEGHAFVCDGVDTNNLYHINWGWGGYQNAYFALSALDPDAQGIGGATSGAGFHLGLCALAGIQPDQGNPLPDHVEIGAESIKLTSAERAARTSRVSVTLTNVENLGFDTFVGYVGVGITDSLGTIYGWLDGDEFTAYDGFVPSASFQSDRLSGQLQSTLSPGKYRLTPIYSNAAKDSYYQMPIQGNLKEIPFTLTTDSVFFNTTVPTPTPEPKDSINTQFAHASITYYPNYGNNFTIWLTTEDVAFDEANEYVTNGTLLALDIYTDDNQSVVGTYSYTTEESPAAGYFSDAYSSIYFAPSKNSAISSGTVTIALDATGNYIFYYCLQLESQQLVGGFLLSTSAIETVEARQQGNRPYTLNNTAITAIDVPMASTLAKQLNASEYSACPYFVRGIVNAVNSSANEIAQSGKAKLTISNDGTTTNKMSAVNMQWLNNAPFTTGDEIAAQDSVVVLGLLYKFFTSGQINSGFVYEHHPYVAPQTALPEIPMEGIVEAYDLLGRHMGTFPSSEKAQEQLPAGIYVLRNNLQTTKIRVL